MLYMVVAMHCEAKPLIKRYSLKRDPGSRIFELYTGGGISLVVSGIGKMRSAIATAYLLSRQEPGEGDAVLNIGVCGSITTKFPIGAPILIHQIRDRETGRQFFPDILFQHTLKEGSIETHNKVVHRQEANDLYRDQRFIPDLVDMEASGFFQAAHRFVGPHQIQLVKVVSDYLEGKAVDKAAVTLCIERELEKVVDFMDQLTRYCSQTAQGDIITVDDRKVLDKLSSHLRLTTTQTHQLTNMARAYKIRTGRGLPAFDNIMEKQVKVKEEGRQAFERIKKALSFE